MTYGTMQAQIADEIMRDDLGPQIKTAIQTAITRHQSARFSFNETYADFNTVIGADEYKSGSPGYPTDLIYMDAVWCTANGSRLPLIQKNWEQFDAMRGTANGNTGRPTHYATFRGSLFIYPVPDQVYSMRVTYLKKLSTLSLDSDTNAWITDGEEVIRMRAEQILYQTVLNDPDLASLAKEAADTALASLQSSDEANTASGTLLGSNW